MKKIQNNARLNCFIAFIDTRLKGIGVAEDNGKSVIKNDDLISQIELIGEDIIKYTSSICTLDKVNFIIQKSISFKISNLYHKNYNELLEIMEKYIKNDDSVIMPTVGLSMLNYCIEKDIIPKCKISAIEISKIIDIMIMKVPDKKDKELIIKMLDIGEKISSEYWEIKKDKR